MSLQDRINILVSNLNISKAEFERRVGWGTSAASRVPETASIERLESIKNAFPIVNLEWLYKGEGNMFLQSDYEDFSQQIPNSRPRLFASLINSLKAKKIISSQKDLAEKIGYNDTYLSQIINSNKNVSDSMFVKIAELDPTFNIMDFKRKLKEIDDPDSVVSSFDSFNSEPIEESSSSNCNGCPKIKIAPIVPPQATNNIVSYINMNKDSIQFVEPSQMFPEYDIIWRVPSSAMSPCIEKGDILYLKRISSEQSILNGSICLIDTTSHGLMLRIVHHQENYLECVSLSKVIPPVTIELSEIKDIFSISGMFKFDVPLHKFNIMSEEYKDKEDSLKQVLDQNTNLISEMHEQGKRIDILLNILSNDRKQD